MSVDTVAASSALRTLEDLSRTSSKSNNLSQQDFLKILVAQMSHQDPLEPTSNTEFIAQMAQFAMLDSFQTLSSDFAKSQAYSMIGQYVYVQNGSDLIFGKVDGVVSENGVNYLMIGGETFNAANVAGVLNAGVVENDIESKLLQGANLIGKTVTAEIVDEEGEDGDTITVTGVVERLTVKDNQVYAVVDGQNISISAIQEIA